MFMIIKLIYWYLVLTFLQIHEVLLHERPEEKIWLYKLFQGSWPEHIMFGRTITIKSQSNLFLTIKCKNDIKFFYVGMWVNFQEALEGHRIWSYDNILTLIVTVHMYSFI